MTVGAGSTPIRVTARAGMLAAVGLLAATAALAGCSSGKVAQTADQQEAIDGVNKTVGSLNIRDAAVDFPAGDDAASYPAGGSAPLTLVLVNIGGTEDTMLSAKSPYAKSITLAPAEAGATPPAIGCTSAASVLPSESPSTPASHRAAAGPSGSASAHPSGSASASASGSAGPSEPAAGPEVSNLAVPSSSAVQLVRGCSHLVLAGLTKPFPSAPRPSSRSP